MASSYVYTVKSKHIRIMMCWLSKIGGLLKWEQWLLFSLLDVYFTLVTRFSTSCAWSVTAPVNIIFLRTRDIVKPRKICCSSSVLTFQTRCVDDSDSVDYRRCYDTESGIGLAAVIKLSKTKFLLYAYFYMLSMGPFLCGPWRWVIHFKSNELPVMGGSRCQR